MEKAKRRHILFDHPYLGALVALVVTWVMINVIVPDPEIVLENVRETRPDLVIPESLEMAMKYASCIAISAYALIALLIHRLWFRKDGYRGCFTRPGLRCREAWLFVLATLVLDVVLIAIDAVTEGTELVMPTLMTTLLSCQAGIYEETTYRGIPVSIMMKNSPSRKRMWIALALTSAVFGGVHMGNVNAGSSLFGAVLQTMNAVGLGMLFGAIYLRSGNILLTMVLHTLHDLIAMTQPGQVTGVITESAFDTFDVLITIALTTVYAAAGIYLLRKSKWEEIKATWANIWAE